MSDGVTIARGLLGVAQVGAGATSEQIGVVQSLLHGYFGVDADATGLAPMSPAEFADFLKADRTNAKQVIARTGIRLEDSPSR